MLGYCRNSANPVGHLVLYLCGYRDAERQRLSDYTCTALQLANFWQDVGVDYAKGRIYLPLEDLRRFGVREDDIRDLKNTPAFREMMRFEVARAREWFAQGLPLVGKVEPQAGFGYRTLQPWRHGNSECNRAAGICGSGRRPSISKARKLALVARAALGSVNSEARARKPR